MAPGSDRSAELARALEARGVAARTLELSGGRFVAAWPKEGLRDPRYRIKVVTAHHDRVPGTPGALDNSAACLQLVDFLSESRGAFNTLVIFTDREELGSARPARPDGPGAARQGSFELGKAFSGMDIGSPMVFPLDVTGRGDALVLSRASETLAARADGALRRSAVERVAAETDAMACSAARLMAGRAPVLRAAVPFGEDLGFMLAGVPALTVTVLPRAEAEALAGLGTLPAWASLAEPGDRAPGTWSRLHGPDDTVDQYGDEAFGVVSRFLARLAAWRAPSSVGRR